MLRVAIGSLALLGFLAALVVHLATYAGVDVASAVPQVWLLHVGCFVVFVPMFLATRDRFQPVDGRNPSLREVFPGWPGTAMGLLMAYAVVNFGMLFLHTQGGSPDVVDGAFVLQDHGRVTAHLTEAEYHLHKAWVVRGFSGHWLVFYGAPALYFLFGRREPEGN